MNKTPNIIKKCCLIAVAAFVLFWISQCVFVLVMIGREGPIYRYYERRDWHDDITQLFSQSGVKVQTLSCTTFDRSRDCDCVFRASPEQIASFQRNLPMKEITKKMIANDKKGTYQFYHQTTGIKDADLALRFKSGTDVRAYRYHHDPGYDGSGGLAVKHHYRISNMVIYYRSNTQDACVSVFMPVR